MRREHRLDVHCIEPGCKEVARYIFRTWRELQTSFELKHMAKHKCLRHSKGNAVLTPQNLKAEWISVPSAASIPNCPSKFFGNSGLICGDGYYVHANDFPEGTRVRIRCEVLLPESATAIERNNG